VQLIIRFYGDAEQIHKNYDFVHCTNYWESKSKTLVLHPEAIESILTKELKYQGSLYPICSVIRTRKFIQRGWYINAGQFLKMSFQISRLDLTDINILREQLTGVDALYFSKIIAICSEKMSKENLTSISTDYVCEVIDRLFN
jgi:hypothetical protein